MNNTQIEEKVKDLCERARVPMCSVSYKTKGNVAGYFYPKDLKVDFNLDLAKDNPLTFFETIIHEVAHYVRYVRNGYTIDMQSNRRDIHGAKWKAVMLELGIPKPKRCHNYVVKRNKHKYMCKCSIYYIATVTHNRMLKGQKRICNSCNTALELKV